MTFSKTCITISTKVNWMQLIETGIILSAAVETRGGAKTFYIRGREEIRRLWKGGK